MFRIAILLIVASMVVGCSSNVPRPAGSDEYVEGVFALNRGEKDQGVADLIAATKRNPKLIVARSRLGDIYRADGDYSKAVVQYEAVVKLDPYDSQNHYKLGLTYQFLNRLQEAITSYVRALQLNDQDGKSAMNAGLCYLALGKTDDAVKYTKWATDIDPAMSAGWTNYGAALDAKGKLAEAEVAYRRALEGDSSNPVTLYNLGSNLVAQGKNRQAIAVLEPLVKATPSAPAHKRLGDAYAASGRDREALEQYNLAIKIDPKYYPAMNEMGRVLITQYKHGLELDENLRKAAVQFWKQSLDIYPDQAEVTDMMIKYERASF